LSLSKAPLHRHNRARETFVTIDGVTQPAPLPRFSDTPGAIQGPPGDLHSSAERIVDEWSQ